MAVVLLYRQALTARIIDARGWMDQRLRSKAGQAVCTLRNTIEEPVFDQNKGTRWLDQIRLIGGEDKRGMGTDGRRSQSAQTVPGIAEGDLRAWAQLATHS